MKRLVLSCILSWSVAIVGFTQTNELEDKLYDLAYTKFEKTKAIQDFPTYTLRIKQPIDHKNVEKGHFYQTVLLVHRGFDKPTVFNTNGYTLEKRPSELCELLDANYVSVEHRYFGNSKPDIDNWQYLNVDQLTADLHRVKTILDDMYTGKWVNTGISKGGETTTYYRYYYPDDMDASVAYVAPFENDLKDKRFYTFLNSVGASDCRNDMYDYQKRVLQAKDELLPLLKYYAKGKGSTFEIIGGLEAAFEIAVLELPFSFWQFTPKCDGIPAENVSDEELFDYLLASGLFEFVNDEAIRYYAPHFYQAGTQYGYYGYETKPLKKYLDFWKGEPSAVWFEGENLQFDGSLNKQVNKWLKSGASEMLFIYGELDPYTAAQAELGNNKKSKKYILAGKHHGDARVAYMDEGIKADFMKQLQAWLK